MAPLLLAGALALQVPPRPMQGPPVPLITRDDYPAVDLRNERTGPVRVRLDIDEAGSVARCTILLSSGSATLDAQTCALLQRRARFIPARDAQGRATTDVVTQTVMWTIEPPRERAIVAAQERWLDCLAAAARPLVAGPSQPFEIADAVIDRCPAQEQQVLRAAKALLKHRHPKTPREARYGVRPDLILRIDAMQAEARGAAPDRK